jgi:lysozyme
MRLSAAGLTLIKKSEGFRSSKYTDTAGLATIGFGHRLLPGETFTDGIDETQAEAILADDVRGAEEAVTRLVRVPLAQGQFDALVDFVFNLGAGRLAGSTLLKDLNAGCYEAAAGQLLVWDRCGGQENPGLKARRLAEHEIWLGDKIAGSKAA